MSFSICAIYCTLSAGFHEKKDLPVRVGLSFHTVGKFCFPDYPDQCATLYLVRIFSAARCAGFRQEKSPGRVGRCRIPQRKSLRRCLGLFLCASCQVLLLGRLQANVQHCTWLGSPVCAAGGGSSTWGNTWESAYSLVVSDERATKESRLLYKKEQHGYNSHRIVCIRSRDCAAIHPLGQKRCGKGHTRLMKRYGDGRKSVPFPLYQVF